MTGNGNSLQSVEVRVLIFKGRRKWVAQCLEFDIAVQAERREDLRDKFYLAVEAERAFCEQRGLEPFSRLPRAPQRYFDTWQQVAALESDEPWRDFPAYITQAMTAVAQEAH